VVVSSRKRSTISRPNCPTIPSISCNLQKDAVLELYVAEPMRYCPCRLRMEGSRTLFNGAGAMRIERGAPRVRRDEDGTSSALLNAAERELPTEGDFQGPVVNTHGPARRRRHPRQRRETRAPCPRLPTKRCAGTQDAAFLLTTGRAGQPALPNPRRAILRPRPSLAERQPTRTVRKEKADGIPDARGGPNAKLRDV
jgi:hypothetical protein